MSYLLKHNPLYRILGTTDLAFYTMLALFLATGVMFIVDNRIRSRTTGMVGIALAILGICYVGDVILLNQGGSHHNWFVPVLSITAVVAAVVLMYIVSRTGMQAAYKEILTTLLVLLIIVNEEIVTDYISRPHFTSSNWERANEYTWMTILFLLGILAMTVIHAIYVTFAGRRAQNKPSATETEQAGVS